MDNIKTFVKENLKTVVVVIAGVIILAAILGAIF